MKWPVGQAVKIFAHGGSLRQRVAYSLAIVRLILVPVFFLALYYLFRMGWIVDRIVGVDAPAATLADQISIQMLEARRAERNYFLLYDSTYLERNRRALSTVEYTIRRIRSLEPQEEATVQQLLNDVNLYRQQFTTAVPYLGQMPDTPFERVRRLVRTYEGDLNNLLAHAAYRTRAELIDDLRARIESFDVEITKMVGTGDPALRQVTTDLQTSSQEILRLASELQARNWQRVQEHHQNARQLLRRAVWVLGIISGLTLVFSVWISFILPRAVVTPLLSLKQAVDHAARGNYTIKLDVQGDGEVAQLAQSVRTLIAQLRERA